MGLQRLRDQFDLIPVEYPTTRTMGSTPQERARDLHAAFADSSIKAILASIGGDDEIRLLPFLDPELLRQNAKPFFGYSDNTNLLAFLFSIGVVAYHGAAVMVEFARPGEMHPTTAASLRAALFDSGDFELQPSPTFGEEDRDWADPATFESPPRMERSDGWIWHNAAKVVEGVAWGGNLEVLAGLLMADRAVMQVGSNDCAVLFIETSEEMPSAAAVYRILRSMGERGLLGAFQAVLVARAKSWSLSHQVAPGDRETYRQAHRDAVLEAISVYAPDAMLVFDVEFGHTDPQHVIPYGGVVSVDGLRRRVSVRY